MLENLISSKTRVRLLIKFFVNIANRGYLNSLATEFGESTNSVRKELNLVDNHMKENARNHFDNHIKQMPALEITNSSISFDEDLEEGFVYEMAFNGNDAEAEIIEKETGFSFLGESTTPYTKERKCVVSGKLTKNRVFIAKTY